MGGAFDREFIDEGISGGTLAASRKGFSELLKFIRNGDTLYVFAVDRLGRDAIDVQSTVRDLLKHGIAGKLSDSQSAYLADILSASKTLETLIDDILDLALIEAGTIELDRKNVEVSEVLLGVMPLVEERARKAKVEIINQTPRQLGELYADQKRLLQIAYNLVINAIEHTPPSGTIAFGAELSAKEVRIFVSDSGVGIPPEYQPVAFERFESGTRTKDARRAGLGLALVRSFVELHGGWVELDSTVGKGTRVTCHFPRQAAEGSGTPSGQAETPDAKAG